MKRIPFQVNLGSNDGGNYLSISSCEMWQKEIITIQCNCNDTFALFCFCNYPPLLPVNVYKLTCSLFTLTFCLATKQTLSNPRWERAFLTNSCNALQPNMFLGGIHRARAYMSLALPTTTQVFVAQGLPPLTGNSQESNIVRKNNRNQSTAGVCTNAASVSQATGLALLLAVLLLLSSFSESFRRLS